MTQTLARDSVDKNAMPPSAPPCAALQVAQRLQQLVLRQQHSDLLLSAAGRSTTSGPAAAAVTPGAPVHVLTGLEQQEQGRAGVGSGPGSSRRQAADGLPGLTLPVSVQLALDALALDRGVLLADSQVDHGPQQRLLGLQPDRSPAPPAAAHRTSAANAPAAALGPPACAADGAAAAAAGDGERATRASLRRASLGLDAAAGAVNGSETRPGMNALRGSQTHYVRIQPPLPSPRGRPVAAGRGMQGAAAAAAGDAATPAGTAAGGGGVAGAGAATPAAVSLGDPHADVQCSPPRRRRRSGSGVLGLATYTRLDSSQVGEG